MTGFDFARPLSHGTYRNVWIASFISNIGTLIQATAAAWAMTRLTSSDTMVALVQSAAALPMVLFTVLSGSIADLYDRRKVTLTGLGIAALSAATLAALTAANHITPLLLLLCCFAVGCGTSLFWPAWQASVRELVPAEAVPSAVALNGISYNIARSIGPAIGGTLVALAGVMAAYVVNALTYLPILCVLFLWRYQRHAPKGEPERLGRSVWLGARYVLHSPALSTVLLRLAAIAFGGSSIMALLPLVTHKLLHGSALTYGILLGCFGLGAVIGGLHLGRLRRNFSDDVLLRTNSLLLGCGLLITAFSGHAVLTAAALVLMGTAWTTSVSLCNVCIQFAAPRWVAGRALAMFQVGMSGGLVAGSYLFGKLAEGVGLVDSIVAAGLILLVLSVLGRWLPMPELESVLIDGERSIPDPPVAGCVDGSVGPVAIMIEYDVRLGGGSQTRRQSSAGTLCTRTKF